MDVQDFLNFIIGVLPWVEERMGNAVETLMVPLMLYRLKYDRY
jgi:hypothetical protein